MPHPEPTPPAPASGPHANLAPARIIARLDIKGSNVIKGIHLEGLRVVGQPGELSRRYYAQGIDEIVYMDVVASLYGRNNILGVVEEAARDVFVPMTVGGGIRTLKDVRDVLRSGADKVAINTAALARPGFLREIAESFGSQCVVLSIEAKRKERGHWEAYVDNGREPTDRDVLEWAQEAEAMGIGEVLVTSVDREGTRKGFDLELIEAVHDRVRVPVIASGGSGKADHVAEILRNGSAEAICCASIFHYEDCSVGDLKAALSASGLDMRL